MSTDGCTAVDLVSGSSPREKGPPHENPSNSVDSASMEIAGQGTAENAKVALANSPAPECDGASLKVEEDDPSSETHEGKGEGGDGRCTSVMTLPQRGRAKLGAGVTTSVMSASRRSTSRDDTMEMDEQPDSDPSHTGDSPGSSSGEVESAAGDSGNEDKQPKRPRAIRLPEDYDWRSLKPRVYGKSLPPLDPSERRTMKASMISRGCFGSRILIDEDKNIIDGNHTWRICMETGITPVVEKISGLTEKEKEEWAYSFNSDRRQLDKEDTAQVFEARLDNLLDLREKNPKKWTQEKLAEMLDVSVSTVSLREQMRHNFDGGTVSKPDARRKYDDDLKREAVRLVKAGMPKPEVARQLLMTLKAVERAVKEAEEREAGGVPAEGGKRKKAAASKPPQPIEEITATEGVPELHRWCLDYLGKDASVFAEWLKAAVEKAREDSEARFADADSELADADVEELNKSTLYHIQRANLDSARLRRIASAGGAADVKETPPRDSRSDGAGPAQVGDYLLGIVTSVEPDQVFVALPVFGGGVIDNHNDCLAKYGPLKAGVEFRVRVAGFDRKRGLWKLQPQARQTVAPAPGAIAGSHRDDRFSPDTKLAGRKAGPKNKEMTK